MRIIILIFFISFLEMIKCSSLNGWVTIWTENINTNHNTLKSLTVDKDNNIYVTGSISNTITGNFDILLLKYSSEGNLLNFKSYDFGKDEGEDIKFNSNYNTIYITGTVYNGSNYDAVLIKVDSNGNSIWTQTYDNGYNEYAEKLAISDDYIYLLCQSYNSITSNYDINILKYDKNGNNLWNSYYDIETNSEYPEDIKISSDNNIYITGYQTHGLAKDGFLVKVDSNGNLKWEKIFDTGENEKGCSITINNNYIYTIYINTSYAIIVKYDSDDDEIERKYFYYTYDYNIGEYYEMKYLVGDLYGYLYVGGYNYEHSIYLVKYDEDFSIIGYYNETNITFEKPLYMELDYKNDLYMVLENTIIKYRQAPYPVLNLSGYKENNFISLTWNNIYNASGYKIYRSYDEINYDYLASVRSGENEFFDSSFEENKIWYKVVATNEAGKLESNVISLLVVNNINDVIIAPTIFSYSKNDYITFYKLSENMKVNIYTLNGKNIKEIICNNKNKYRWDVKDFRGRKLSRGIYIICIDNNNSKRYLTFIIK